MGVYFKQKGDFNKVQKWFNFLLDRQYLNVLSTYGRMGVEALRAATPVHTGLAASSWNFEIGHDGKTTTLTWVNNDIEGGYAVAVLVDRGHVTKSGSWVPGEHFIDAALDPVIEQLENALWKEVIG